ncbi:MAG: hypothetical protein KBD07_04695 [Candidatus Omnitrophica bacterium]|nr:hypothetical protein [Candidatus Omnitrophota bacterium]
MRTFKQVHHMILLLAATSFAMSLPTGFALAAEISNKPAGATDPRVAGPYKKKIPGSTNVIAGSRPRTYIKPKKQTYSEHMDSLKTERFKNESDSFGYNKSKTSSAFSGPHSSRQINSSRPPSSRLHIKNHLGTPGPGMSRNEKLSTGDFVFMGKVTDALKSSDPETASRMAGIMSGQKEGRTLNPEEYAFLQAMSGKINDGQAAYRLRSIAEKRREI